MAPIIAMLMKYGLGTLAGAVLSKGPELIQEKLGVDISSMLGTEEGRVKLKELEIKHEEFLINAALEEKKIDVEADKVAQTNVTDRWKADMASDSWLSKNVRPVVLLYVTGCVTIMALMSGITQTFRVQDKWIDLLETLVIIIYSAYFVGRTTEKGIHTWKKPK